MPITIGSAVSRLRLGCGPEVELDAGGGDVHAPRLQLVHAEVRPSQHPDGRAGFVGNLAANYKALLPVGIGPVDALLRSRRGNDLVRRYLGMAALSAVRGNPAVR